MPPPPPPPSPPHSPSSTDDLLANAGALVPWVAPAEPVVANGGGKRKKKKPAAGRAWSESDDLRILEALAAYAAAHGAAPSRSNLRAALAGCRLDKAEFTVTEIYEKVRRLRLRYTRLRSSAAGTTVPIPAGSGGDDEARKYELSMAIWGGEPLNNSATKARATNATANGDCNGDGDGDGDGDAVPRARVRREVEELQELYPSLALAVDGITDDELLRPHYKRAFQLIGDEKARELDARVKKQMVNEAKMTAGRAALKNQVLDMLIASTD